MFKQGGLGIDFYVAPSDDQYANGVKLMKIASNKQPNRLEDLPNIGKAIAADLRSLGILRPEQLARQVPLATYQALAAVMGTRLDPCVFYTLLAVGHFQKTGERLPWWQFTEQGRELLFSHRQG